MPSGVYPRRVSDPMDRFVQRLRFADTGCIEWTGWTNGVAYGKFYAGKDQPKAYAHRWVYEQLVGPIPPRMTIDHLCRNTLCVNPDHLEVVTQCENTDRGTARQRLRETLAAIDRCPNGHEYSPENTYRWAGRDYRQRSCRACARDRMRARRSRNIKEKNT